LSKTSTLIKHDKIPSKKDEGLKVQIWFLGLKRSSLLPSIDPINEEGKNKKNITKQKLEVGGGGVLGGRKDGVWVNQLPTPYSLSLTHRGVTGKQLLRVYQGQPGKPLSQIHQQEKLISNSKKTRRKGGGNIWGAQAI